MKQLKDARGCGGGQHLPRACQLARCRLHMQQANTGTPAPDSDVKAHTSEARLSNCEFSRSGSLLRSCMAAMLQDNAALCAAR